MKIKMIVYLMILIVISISVANAEVNVDEILNRLIEYQDLVKDQNMDITMTIHLPGGREIVKHQKCILRHGRDRKIRMETLSSGATMVMIISENKMIMKNGTGEVSTMQMPMVGNMGNSNIEDIQKYSKGYDIEINLNESDEINNLYVLDLNPKQGINDLSKCKLYIDNEKGVIIKEENIDNEGNVTSVIEKKEFVEIDGLWVVKRAETTYPGLTGMKTEVFYENIKINKGVSDEIFNLE